MLRAVVSFNESVLSVVLAGQAQPNHELGCNWGNLDKTSKEQARKKVELKLRIPPGSMTIKLDADWQTFRQIDSTKLKKIGKDKVAKCFSISTFHH